MEMYLSDLRWKCTYPVLVYVREVHVRYYIWRELLGLYQKVHVSCNDKSVGGIMSVNFQIRIREDEEACCLARCNRNRTLIVLFWYSFQVEGYFQVEVPSK